MKTVVKTLTGKIKEVQDKIKDVEFKMENWDFEFAGELTFFENDLTNLKALLIEYQQALEIINTIDFQTFKKWLTNQLKEGDRLSEAESILKKINNYYDSPTGVELLSDIDLLARKHFVKYKPTSK